MLDQDGGSLQYREPARDVRESRPSQQENSNAHSSDDQVRPVRHTPGKYVRPVPELPWALQPLV